MTRAPLEQADRPGQWKLAEVAARATRIVVAWGIRGSLRDRAERVLSAILRQPPLYGFGETCAGEPRHPLYIPRIAHFR
jgi:hypothetical protein